MRFQWVFLVGLQLVAAVGQAVGAETGARKIEISEDEFVRLVYAGKGKGERALVKWLKPIKIGVVGDSAADYQNNVVTYVASIGPVKNFSVAVEPTGKVNLLVLVHKDWVGFIKNNPLNFLEAFFAGDRQVYKTYFDAYAKGRSRCKTKLWFSKNLSSVNRGFIAIDGRQSALKIQSCIAGTILHSIGIHNSGIRTNFDGFQTSDNRKMNPKFREVLRILYHPEFTNLMKEPPARAVFRQLRR